MLQMKQSSLVGRIDVIDRENDELREQMNEMEESRDKLSEQLEETEMEKKQLNETLASEKVWHIPGLYVALTTIIVLLFYDFKNI